QVDLWTQSSSGCACPGDGGDDCACCVRDGACPCGEVAPTRCAQCGLEQYCSNMCNITIDSRILRSKSGKTFGQIKSPSIEGPGYCSYLLQPDAGQRVEIQIYRLLSVGRFNGSSCVGGWLQLGGASAVQDASGAAETRLCGANERYTPPVVLFADHGASILDFRYAFILLTLGIHILLSIVPVIPIKNNYLFLDTLASLVLFISIVLFFPRIKEKTVRSQFLAFFSFTSLSNTQGVGFHPRGGSRIPHTDCDWLYQDVSCRSAPCVLASPGYPGLYPPHRRCRYLLATNSVHTRVKIIFTSIILPRNHCSSDYLTLRAGSSPSAPLLASICSERSATLEQPGPNLLLEFNSGPLVPPYDYNGFIARLEFLEKIETSGPPPTVLAASEPLAALTHHTHHGDKLAIENDVISNEISSNGRVGCGATVRGYGAGGARSGHFDTRSSAWRTQCAIHLLGTPADVVQVSLFNYNLRALLRVCGPSVREARDPSGRFLVRQAVTSKGANLTILIRRAASQSADEEEFVDGAFAFHDEQHEGTVSPDATCASTHYGLAAPPHGGVSAPAHHHVFWNIEERLLCTHRFIPAANQSVTIESAWLPVVVRSWTSLRLEYSVAHYTYASRGFDYAAAYSFNDDAMCGQRTYTDKSCSSWNITIHEWSGRGVHTDGGLAATAGDLLYTFCARNKNQTYTLPWRLNTVVIRLVALSRQQPLYTIRWRSQVVRANTRLGPPTPAPAASAMAGHITVNILTVLIVLFSFYILIIIVHWDNEDDLHNFEVEDKELNLSTFIEPASRNNN
ncbi:unnamed protein product, partial [Leptidea sinapis]